MRDSGGIIEERSESNPMKVFIRRPDSQLCAFIKCVPLFYGNGLPGCLPHQLGDRQPLFIPSNDRYGNAKGFYFVVSATEIFEAKIIPFRIWKSILFNSRTLLQLIIHHTNWTYNWSQSKNTANKHSHSRRHF